MERIDLHLAQDQVLCLWAPPWRTLCQLRWCPRADAGLRLDLWIPDDVRADQSRRAGRRVVAALDAAEAQEARAFQERLRTWER